VVAPHQALRLGEVPGLDWDDVDFVGNRLRVAHSLGRDGTLGPPKGAKVLTIPLTAAARETLLEMRLDGGSGFVFKNTLGSARQLRDVQRAFNKARDRAALEDGVCFHSLRHTGISRAANHPAIPLVHVREFARHADLATTQGYVHRIEDSRVTVAFDEALTGGAA
jgi:integrase